MLGRCAWEGVTFVRIIVASRGIRACWRAGRPPQGRFLRDSSRAAAGMRWAAMDWVWPRQEGWNSQEWRERM